MDSLVGLRPWSIMLKFLDANSKASARPIPSLAPVIRAHGELFVPV